MKQHHPRRWYAAGCVLGGVLLGAAVVWAIHSGGSLRTLLAGTLQNPLLAAVLLLLGYGLKSATIFFPILLLEMAAGYLFPTPIALMVNLLGVLIVLTVPYWLGRTFGLRQVSKLTQKYPKFQAVMEKQTAHSLFLCFFLRVISCLPGDLVTMYLGAARTPFSHNLLGGVLGIVPGMVLATVMGLNIRDPASPAFWISAALSAGLAVLSTALYSIYRKRQKREDDTHET